MGIFRKSLKDIVEGQSLGMMTIYSASMYGRGTIFVSPGRAFPQVEDWCKRAEDPNDGFNVSTTYANYAVRFADGAATVESRLGEFLIAEGLAHRAPQLATPLPATAWEDTAATLENGGRPRYAKPIAVGRPLNPFELERIAETSASFPVPAEGAV